MQLPARTYITHQTHADLGHGFKHTSLLQVSSDAWTPLDSFDFSTLDRSILRNLYQPLSARLTEALSFFGSDPTRALVELTKLRDAINNEIL